MFATMRCPLLFGFAIVALALVGCEKPASKTIPEPTPAQQATFSALDVGVFLPFDGNDAVTAQDALNGLQLAAEQCNAGGGVNGRPVRLVVRDTDGTPESAEKAIRALMEDDEVAVAALIGIGSGAQVASVVEELQVPLIAIGSTMAARMSSEPWVSRICYSDYHSGHIMAEMAFTLGALRGIVLYDPEDMYAQTLALSFGKKFKSKQRTAFVGEPYKPDATDFSGPLQNIKSKNPDIVYLPADDRISAEILKQARSMGLTMPFLGTATWDSPEFLTLAGNAANGCYLPARYNPNVDDEKVMLFAPAYAEKFGTAPTAPSALGYESLVVLTHAIRSAGSSGAKDILNALHSIKDLPGLTGPITIDPERIFEFSVPVLKVEDGKFKYLETLKVK